MIKHDLRAQGCSVEEISPKQFKINMIWAIISVSMIVITYVSLTAFVGYSSTGAAPGGSPIDIPANPGMMPFYLLEILFAVFIYLALKFYITIALCKDKKNSVKLKILENKGMPVCHCKEALKISHALIIYILPFVIVYTAMFILCITMVEEIFEMVEAGCMTMLFFMTFFFGFDLAAAAYVIYFRIKYKIDYISIDHHIYAATAFKKTYVKFKRKSTAAKYTHKRNDQYLEDGKFKFR